MKRIVLNKHDETIGIDKVRSTDYIGIIYNNKKYYVVKKKDREYMLVQFIDTDISDNSIYNSPAEIILFLNTKESFVFDTREELLNWLKQD